MLCCLCVVFLYPRPRSTLMQLDQADASARRACCGLLEFRLASAALWALPVAGLPVVVAVVLMVCLIHP